MAQMTEIEAVLDQIARLEQALKLQALNSKTVLTIEEAAQYTGRSTSNLYKLTAKGIIPHCKPYGSRIYFDRQELDDWMRQNPVRTAAQIDGATATHATLHPHGSQRKKAA